jgi:serine/threonine-protein kinase
VNDDALLGVIAVQEGFLSQAQLDQAQREQDGRRLLDLLREQKLLSDPQVEAILDIQRVHMAEVSAAAESEGFLSQDRFMLPCTGCDTYYVVQGFAEGTKFLCRKCLRVLTVHRDPSDPGFSKAPAAAPAAQRKIGPYELIGEIGRGAMSVIYKAVDTRSSRTIVLKVLKEGDMPSPSRLHRFQQEALAARRLSHPNIVAVHEAGDIGGTYYIAMDLVEGITLDRALALGKLRLAEFVAVLEKVARAVHHAHQMGIVHRDLKPANILLDEKNEPHVTDFGLAKMDHVEKGATQGGAALGTPFYMSPEQVSGDVSGTDARSDIYAMGVILYEALTGRVPYPGNSVMDVYRAILGTPITPPAKHNPRTPTDLQAICLKALERDKRQRYESARDFADDLRRHLDGKPVQALSGRRPDAS